MEDREGLRIDDAITLFMVQGGLLEGGSLEGAKVEDALHALVQSAGFDRREPLEALFLEDASA